MGGFSQFYPFYLSQHADRTCRRLHFVGTSLGLLAVLHAFAWVGHFFFENNRPATFTHPLYSFVGDWVMWKDMLSGRIRF
jgi:hypothetical protein